MSSDQPKVDKRMTIQPRSCSSANYGNSKSSSFVSSFERYPSHFTLVTFPHYTHGVLNLCNSTASHHLSCDLACHVASRSPSQSFRLHGPSLMGYTSLVRSKACKQMLRRNRENPTEMHYKSDQILTSSPQDSSLLRLGGQNNNFGKGVMLDLQPTKQVASMSFLAHGVRATRAKATLGGLFTQATTGSFFFNAQPLPNQCSTRET